jgi:pimeloyl-ACP methyl ester carboxylesterase
MTKYTRRSLIGAAAAGAGAAAMTGGWASAADAADTDPPGARGGTPTFVLVNGTCASSSWWTPLARELGLRGYRTVAVDLPGHGVEGHFPLAYQAPQDLAALATVPSPLAGITIEDYESRVVGIVRRARRNGPVILVGHSEGGVSLSRASNAVPHLLDRIVYIASMCCVDLPSVDDYLATPEGSTSLSADIGRYGSVGDAEALGVLRVNWRSADPQFLAAFKQAVAADYSDSEVRALLNLLEPDETLSIFGADARGLPDRWGRVPRTYIRFTKDLDLPLALQDRMIAEADRLTPRNRFDVRSVAAPHAGPMHRPEVVAILDELGGRAARSSNRARTW